MSSQETSKVRAEDKVIGVIARQDQEQMGQAITERVF
jgi:hypothetical protein